MSFENSCEDNLSLSLSLSLFNLMDIASVVVLTEKNIQDMAQGMQDILSMALLNKFVQSGKNICASLSLFN